MILVKYVIYFLIFSFIGWIYECVYCSINEGRFQNRGFLYGPVCPIYGFGAVSAMILYDLAGSDYMAELPWWEIFLVCMAGSAVLEYITSYVLEMRFHAVWWDYSHMPLNLHGRICLPASLLFGVMGLALVKGLFPWLDSIRLYQNDLLYTFAALLIAFVIGMDTSLTISALTDLVGRLDGYQAEFNAKAEAGYEFLQNRPEAIKAAVQEKRSELSARMAERYIHDSNRQKYHFRSIRGFRGDYAHAAEYMKEIRHQMHTGQFLKKDSEKHEPVEKEDARHENEQ
ncbi:MAG: putative ABC transporter permease [Firmicutes bacterium]|nr:putative ABC transporter permease [Bacillota bacterium]